MKISFVKQSLFTVVTVKTSSSSMINSADMMSAVVKRSEKCPQAVDQLSVSLHSLLLPLILLLSPSSFSFLTVSVLPRPHKCDYSHRDSPDRHLDTVLTDSNQMDTGEIYITKYTNLRGTVPHCTEVVTSDCLLFADCQCPQYTVSVKPCIKTQSYSSYIFDKK